MKIILMKTNKIKNYNNSSFLLIFLFFLIIENDNN